MLPNFCKIKWLAACVVFFSSLPAFAQSKLTIAYLERPPFYFTKDGKAEGIIVDRTRQVLDAASVKTEFIPMSVSRVMSELKAKSHQVCSLGWFKTPERQKMAVFSQAIYQMRPMVLLLRQEDEKIFAGFTSIREVFANKSLVMGKAAGFSYGNYVDSLIKKMNTSQSDTEPLHENLLKMLDRKRIAYMIVPPEEVDSLLASAQLPAEKFVTHRLKDFPEGEASYIMCNKSVGDETLKKIDAAIAKLFPTL